jgi:formylglycine-generating enzyme
MGTSARGGIYRTGSGLADDPYFYHVKSSMENKPVNYVSVFDGMRFANWLNNGAGLGDTEDGAYLLTGAKAVPDNATAILRKPTASVFLPNEDEWYKAAYYEPGASGDSYWKYGTRSDSAPTMAVADSDGDVVNPGVNVANYNYHFVWNGLNGNVSTVGSAGPSSESYYGAADMTGNQFEFTETHNSSSLDRFIYRGGCWGDGIGFQSSATRVDYAGSYEIDPAFGFRVAAAVPEPSSLVLVTSSICCPMLLFLGRKRFVVGSNRPAVAT